MGCVAVLTATDAAEHVLGRTARVLCGLTWLQHQQQLLPVPAMRAATVNGRAVRLDVAAAAAAVAVTKTMPGLAWA